MMNRQAPEEQGSRHVGYRSARLAHPQNDLEAAFAKAWTEKQELHDGWTHDVLRDNEGRTAHLSETECRTVATFVQWLGSNNGFGFLCSVLREAGYEVNESPHADPNTRRN